VVDETTVNGKEDSDVLVLVMVVGSMHVVVVVCVMSEVLVAVVVFVVGFVFCGEC